MVQDVVDLNAKLHARAVVLKSVATAPAGLACDGRIDGEVTAGRKITWATWRELGRAARSSTGARRESTGGKTTGWQTAAWKTASESAWETSWSAARKTAWKPLPVRTGTRNILRFHCCSLAARE